MSASARVQFGNQPGFSRDNSDDFMSFFTSEIVSFRKKINGILPTINTNVSSSIATLEVSREPDLY